MKISATFTLKNLDSYFIKSFPEETGSAQKIPRLPSLSLLIYSPNNQYNLCVCKPLKIH